MGEILAPNNGPDALWLPSTANRAHEAASRPLARAEASVADTCGFGPIAGTELEPHPSRTTLRTAGVFRRCFETGVPVCTTGEVVALNPPSLAERSRIARTFGVLCQALYAEAV